MLRWVDREELPPDEVIASLVGQCGHHSSRIAFQMGWPNVTRGEVPYR